MLPEGHSLEKYAASQVSALAERLAQVPAPHELTRQIQILGLEEKANFCGGLDEWCPAKGRFLYAISFPDADAKQIHGLFANARTSKIGACSYARLLPFSEKSKDVAYVGSSRALRKRLLEHFGFGAKSTYSLHVAQWGISLGSARVDVRIYPDDTDDKLMLMLEDQWADFLWPLFGRRGSL